jgi:hypothetical protein
MCNGIEKDYLGTLSDYVECLMEQENDSSSYLMTDGNSDKNTKRTRRKA